MKRGGTWLTRGLAIEDSPDFRAQATRARATLHRAKNDLPFVESLVLQPSPFEFAAFDPSSVLDKEDAEALSDGCVIYVPVFAGPVLKLTNRRVVIYGDGLFLSGTRGSQVREALISWRNLDIAAPNDLLRCRYSDCVEGHAVAEEDELVTCRTCRKELL